jgi:NAD dependent epimerase/dehydratase family enzyme
MVDAEACCMKVLVSGGSGLVGTALTESLRSEGHTVAHLVRPGGEAAPGDIRWDPASGFINTNAMEAADAVVNLNGASIGGGRWTPERKKILHASRIAATRLLVDAFTRLKQRPRVFLSASAIGYYGNRGDEVLTESSAAGNDFLAGYVQYSLASESFFLQKAAL